MVKDKKKDNTKIDATAKGPTDKIVDKKQKKKTVALPSEFVMGARVEILEHVIESMVLKRGICLGSSKISTTPRKRLMVCIKLEAPIKKGAAVDTSSM